MTNGGGKFHLISEVHRLNLGLLQ